MTIILFVVDTSASMNQRTYHGMSLVDVASKAINDFVQQRRRDPNSRGDRYMLMTFEETPFHLKAGWKENQETFDSSLKTVAANQLNDVGSALQNAFTMLNVNKLQAGKETYGAGRFPSLLDPTVIILISDGVSFQAQQQNTDALLSQIAREVALFRRDGGAGAVPPQPTLANIKLDIPGGSLTDAPYRWDQRLFSWILHFPGRQSAVSAATNSTPSPSGFMPSAASMLPAARDASSLLDRYAAETGGRSFLIDNFATLQSVIAYTCQKVVPGVVVEFQAADRNVVEQIVRATTAAANAALEAPATPRASVTKSPASGGESENNDLIISRPHQHNISTAIDADIIVSTRTAEVVPAAVDAALAEVEAVMLELKDGLKQMLIVKRESANKTPLINALWPIPENFPLEDGYQQALPPRPVHPQFELLFDIDKTVKVPHSAVQGGISFAVDRFDLEPSAFCDCLLRISALYKDCSWPISISVRSKLARAGAATARSNTPNTSSIPCGYLKASSPNVMSLYLLPAHYEKLFRILETYKLLQKPTTLFRDELFSYVSNIPFYVRDALLKYGFRGFDTTPMLAQLLQESIHASPPSGLSHALASRIRKDKADAKRVHDELVARGVVLRAHDATVPIMPRDTGTFESQTQDIWHIWKDIIEVRGMQQGFEQLERMRAVFQDLLKRQAIRIAARRPPAASFHSVPDNPFDVERDQLLLGLRKSRRALMDGPGKQTWFAESADDVDDARHSMPSSAMSNFVEFKKSLPLMPELRGLDVGGERTQSFGNPFKSKQAQRDSITNATALGALVDEFDIDLMPSGNAEGLAHAGGGDGNSNPNAALNSSSKHQHFKSKKTSISSRKGRIKLGGGAGFGIGGGGIGAFMNRSRGPLSRSFVWMPSAERRKRSASVSEYGDRPSSPMPPLSPALSLPDLTFSSADNEQLFPGGSFSAPSSPQLLSLLLPSSPSVSPTYTMPDYQHQEQQRQNFDADGDYNMLPSSSDTEQNFAAGTLSNTAPSPVAEDSAAVQASYAALVHHQDHLRMTKEKLSVAKQPSPVQAPDSARAFASSAVTINHRSTNELLESAVFRSSTRGEYEFRRSSWFYGLSLLDAKQKLRQLIRNASAHQQLQQANRTGTMLSSSPSFLSTTSENEMVPIADVLRQFASDDEIHLHLIVDSFNEALRFHLLALAHHIYDYFLLQTFESRIAASNVVDSDQAAHRSSVQVVAATACLLQHYVPKPHAQLMNRFRSQTAHLLPITTDASAVADDENSSTSVADKLNNLPEQLPQLVLVDESRRLMNAALAAGSSSSSSSSSDAALALPYRRCPAADHVVGSIRNLMHARPTNDSAQHQRQVFAQKLQAVKLSETERNTTANNTTSAKNELLALYERVNLRDSANDAHVRPTLSEEASHTAATTAATAIKQEESLIKPEVTSSSKPSTTGDSFISNVKTEALPVSTSNNRNGLMVNGGLPNNAPAVKRHASLNDDEEQKRIALKMRYQKDMLGVAGGGAVANDNPDAGHYHHHARASTISSPAVHLHSHGHENMLPTLANGSLLPIKQPQVDRHADESIPSRVGGRSSSRELR